MSLIKELGTCRIRVETGSCAYAVAVQHGNAAAMMGNSPPWIMFVFDYVLITS